MRNIIFAVFLLLFMNIMVLGEEFNSDKACTLTHDFLTQLKDNTPFTYKDEEKYFGKITLYSAYTLMQLGYIDEKGAWKKPKPPYSYLCELIRINSSLLFMKKAETQYVFAGIPHIILENNSFSSQLFSAKVAYVQHEKSTSASLTSEAKIVIFHYRIPQNKLDFPIYINGKSFAELIGYELSPDGIPVLKSEILKKLVEHIESLENNK